MSVKAGQSYLLAGQDRITGAFNAARELGLVPHHLDIPEELSYHNINPIKAQLSAIFSADPKAAVIFEVKRYEEPFVDIFMEVVLQGVVQADDNEKGTDISQGTFFFDVHEPALMNPRAFDRLSGLRFSA